MTEPRVKQPAVVATDTANDPRPPSMLQRVDFDIEPEPLPPRSWSMPVIPDDVKAVRDRYGCEYERVPPHYWRHVASLTPYEWPIGDLLNLRGPLVEVVEGPEGTVDV